MRKKSVEFIYPVLFFVVSPVERDSVHFVQNPDGMNGSREVGQPSNILQRKVTGAGERSLTAEELQTAKIRLIRYIQCEEFPDEVAPLRLKSKGTHGTAPVVKKSSRLSALSPLMGEDGLIRVGGRLNRKSVSTQNIQS